VIREPTRANSRGATVASCTAGSGTRSIRKKALIIKEQLVVYGSGTRSIRKKSLIINKQQSVVYSYHHALSSCFIHGQIQSFRTRYYNFRQRLVHGQRIRNRLFVHGSIKSLIHND
jgi:hypothetical protein